MNPNTPISGTLPLGAWQQLLDLLLNTKDAPLKITGPLHTAIVQIINNAATAVNVKSQGTDTSDYVELLNQGTIEG